MISNCGISMPHQTNSTPTIDKRLTFKKINTTILFSVPPAALIITQHPFPKSVKQNKPMDDGITVRLLVGAAANVLPSGPCTAQLIAEHTTRVTKKPAAAMQIQNNVKAMENHCVQFTVRAFCPLFTHCSFGLICFQLLLGDFISSRHSQEDNSLEIPPPYCGHQVRALFGSATTIQNRIKCIPAVHCQDKRKSMGRVRRHFT